MTVSMLQLVIELPEATSLKEKRMVINSLKHRVIRKFHVSAAEVDLQDSLRFGQIGIALVSNNRSFGESVMQKILSFIENEYDGRIHDAEVYSEIYD